MRVVELSMEFLSRIASFLVANGDGIEKMS